MAKTHVITARVSPDVAEALELLARRLERSRAWIVSEAVSAYVAEQTEFLDFIDEGIEDLESGRWISHEDLVREMKEWREKRHAA